MDRMRAPLISLIIPVRNIDGYLNECLDSITKQDFQDIEIIAVDGDSEDGSVKILEERRQEDPRVKVLRRGRIGPGGARNVGARQASGDYLWFVDGDDVVLDGSLAAIARRIQVSRPDLLLIGHEAVYPDGATQPDNDQQLLARKTAETFTVADEPWTLQLRMACWNKIIRREFFDVRSAAFLTAWPHEDIPVSCLLLLAAQRLSILSQICYRYRKDRPGSEVTSASLRSHFTVFQSYEMIMAEVERRIHDNELDLTEDVRCALFERVIWHYSNIFDEDQRRVRGAGSNADAGARASWHRDRREFFTRMHEDFHRYAPAGYRPSSDPRGVKLRLVKLNAYRVYSAMQPLNDFRTRGGQADRDG
jgi:CDP-glycerol glycerophosphotransferase